MTESRPSAGNGVEPSNEIMRAIAAASLDALITIDASGAIVEFSPAAESLYGYSRSEVLGRPVAEIVIPERMRGAHDAGMDKYKRTGEGPVINNRVEVPSVKRDGSEFDAELTVVPLQIAEEQFFTAFVRDISVQKRQAAELRQARELAERANAAKSRFLATMSHELRTPLHSILGAHDLLGDANLGERERALANVIQQSGETLLGLIGEILDFSRMETDGIELHLEAVALRPLAEQVVERVRSMTDEKGLNLELSLPPDLPPWVLADEVRLRHVLFNLLHNAQKFTSEGGVSLDLQILEQNADDLKLRFVVADTGIGIADEMKDRLFEEFALADDSDTTAFAGAGLGLAISQRLVQAMGGAIRVQSQIGKGSEFSFELSLPLTSAKERLKPTTIGGEARILVVEDGATNQLIIRAMLERAGYEVNVAANGAEALKIMQRQQFHAVLMDLRMPVMDGLESTRRIRAQRSACAQVPIIALTANVSEEDKRRCFEAGMNDFLPKPIDRVKLLERLALWCGQSDRSQVLGS